MIQYDGSVWQNVLGAVVIAWWGTILFDRFYTYMKLSKEEVDGK